MKVNPNYPVVCLRRTPHERRYEKLPAKEKGNLFVNVVIAILMNGICPPKLLPSTIVGGLLTKESEDRFVFISTGGFSKGMFQWRSINFQEKVSTASSSRQAWANSVHAVTGRKRQKWRSRCGYVINSGAVCLSSPHRCLFTIQRFVMIWLMIASFWIRRIKAVFQHYYRWWFHQLLKFYRFWFADRWSRCFSLLTIHA